MTPPFALLVRGPASEILDLSDALGFESNMTAMAVSVFEDGSSRVPSGRMFVQALYENQAEAEAALAALTLGPDLEFNIQQLPDEDWVSLSQAGLPPVRAGRFWIYGSHDAGAIPGDVTYPILIDAGLAFGTGHHGTTQGCLLIFDDLISHKESPRRVLDLGCGAGVLAIAAAKALKRNIIATDIDSDAVDVTGANAQINDVATSIAAHQADGFDSPILAGQSFDLIFANILAGPLMGLAPDIAKALAPSGRVILSGIIDEQSGNVTEAFESQGLKITTYPSINGWTSLLGQK